MRPRQADAPQSCKIKDLWKRKIVLLSTTVVVVPVFLVGATACGGVQQEEVETPLQEITQPIDKARDVKQQVEDAQQQRQQ